MLYSEARRPARRTAEGAFVPLAQQDRSRWDSAMIEEAEAALRSAMRAGRIGRFQLEAAIQSAHVEGARTGATPWPAILTLYNVLVKLTGSPVAAVNRALALAEVEGPAAGLAALDAVALDRRLGSYQPYWAVRAHLLAGAADYGAARDAYRLAIGLERDPALREYLSRRSEELPGED
jgi:RNA polymerase sigma-70 factor (ECF subfamily)